MKIKKLHESSIIPQYQTEGSAALDLHACSYSKWESKVISANGGRALIKTGLAIAVPSGYMALVTPRSGSAFKNGITVTNSPGIIDSDYRGDVGVIIQNEGIEDFIINDGDRIAQLSIVPVLRVDIEQVEFLDDTERGTGGFGSTGVN